MILELSTWVEIDAWLKNNRTILIPVGSMEQHGPTGYIGTDALCPGIIARDAEKKDAETMLLGPTFNVGCAQHHLAFPGTITLRPSTMIDTIVDWTKSLARHGFRQFYWFNGHGGNIATINAAFSEIHAARSFREDGAELPGLHMKLVNWWEFPEVFDLCKRLYPVGHGSHATASEISVTYAAHPPVGKEGVELSPKVAPDGRFGDAFQYRKRFRDGRIGSDPSLSNAEDGQRIISTASTCLRADFKAFSTKPEGD